MHCKKKKWCSQSRVSWDVSQNKCRETQAFLVAFMLINTEQIQWYCEISAMPKKQSQVQNTKISKYQEVS